MKKIRYTFILALTFAVFGNTCGQVVRQPDAGLSIERSKRILEVTSDIAGTLYLNNMVLSEIKKNDSLAIVNIAEKNIDIKFMGQDSLQRQAYLIIPARGMASVHIANDAITVKEPDRRYESVASGIKGKTVFYVPDKVWFIEADGNYRGVFALTGGYRFMPGIAFGAGITNHPAWQISEDYKLTIPYLRFNLNTGSTMLVFFLNGDIGIGISSRSSYKGGFYNSISGGLRLGLNQQLYIQLGIDSRRLDTEFDVTYYNANGSISTVREQTTLQPVYLRLGIGFQFL